MNGQCTPGRVFSNHLNDKVAQFPADALAACALDAARARSDGCGIHHRATLLRSPAERGSTPVPTRAKVASGISRTTPRMKQTATEAVSASRFQVIVEQQDSPRADRCENKRIGWQEQAIASASV